MPLCALCIVGSVISNAVVFVEGRSDREAVNSLAERYGRDLDAERVSIVAMSGASAFGKFVCDVMAKHPSGLKMAGLCDEGEVRDYQKGLKSAGFGSELSRSKMESLGFFVCVQDLEDELIRSLGASSVLEVIEEQGELRSFRTFQNQPHWRGQRIEDQLRRFLGIRSGRKVRYGRLLVEALDLTRVPRPLAGVLAHI